MARRPAHALIAVRGAVALAAGAAVAAATVTVLEPAAAVLAGWAATALVGACWTLLVVWPMDAAATRLHATGEDPGQRVGRAIAVVGSVASIGAVIVVLTRAQHVSQAHGLLLAGLALASVVASWLLIQTVYLVRIADTYYREPEGGILFNQPEPPSYSDFAYVAFGVGVAYQIADTNVTSNAMRRVILGQSLLGYLFGAVILGTVINLFAGL